MGHVAPHRWAELARGRVGAGDERRMRAHADGCAACATARDRVLGATRAFADVATAAAPELGWDHIRARVYWATSSERRERERTQRMQTVRLRRWGLVAVPAVAAAAAAGVLWLRAGGDPAAGGAGTSGAGARSPIARVAAPPPPAAPAPSPAPLTGVVTLAQGGVDVDGAASPAQLMAHAVRAGSKVATGDGRIAVQFGDGSGFALGPRTTLDVRRFDGGGVDLALAGDGDITIEVAPRAPGQRFTVHAGARTVEVRGTAFRVARHGDTVDVACSHGLVAVRDATGDVLVPAGQGVVVGDAEALADRAAHRLDDAAIAALNAGIGPRLPVWADPDTMYRTSAPLAIGAPAGRGLRVDGVAVGAGPMLLRVMSGRHLVQGALAAGGYGPGEWVEAGPGRPDGRIDARVDVTAEVAVAGHAAAPVPPRTAHASLAGSPEARAARKAELDGALDHARVSRCTRALAKQGILDTHVELEVGVDAAGAITFLNVVDTDVPDTMAACVRDAVAAVHFRAGTAATFTERLDF